MLDRQFHSESSRRLYETHGRKVLAVLLVAFEPLEPAAVCEALEWTVSCVTPPLLAVAHNHACSRKQNLMMLSASSVLWSRSLEGKWFHFSKISWHGWLTRVTWSLPSVRPWGTCKDFVTCLRHILSKCPHTSDSYIECGMLARHFCLPESWPIGPVAASSTGGPTKRLASSPS